MSSSYEIEQYLKNNPELQKELLEDDSASFMDNAQEITASKVDGDIFCGTLYRLIDSWLYRVIKKQNEEEEKHYIANFYIKPLAETTKDNGQDIEKYFSLQAIQDGKELHQVEIPADKFSNMNWIIPNYGMKLRTATGQNTLAYLRDSIQSISNSIPQKSIFAHTGWRCINGKWGFLHNGGCIGIDGITVELQGRLSNYLFPIDGDTKQAGKMALKFLDVAPRQITIPIFSITVLSVLNEFLRQEGIEPSFAMFLLGYSGTMKSTLAALALCFFGRFDNKTLPSSFKDTANSLEKQGFILKDVLTVVDDFHPTGSRAEIMKMEATAQAITRGYGDRTGRGRMDSNTTLKKGYAPRGNLIITGEDLPNIGQSGLARHLTIEVRRGDIDKAKLTELQNNSQELSLFMKGFIEWLIPQIDNLKPYLKKQFTQLRSNASREGQHNRLAEVVAHLQIAFNISMNYFTEIGCLSEAEAEQLNNECWNCLVDLTENQSKRIEEDRPVVKFVTALKELLSTNQCYVFPLDETNHAGGNGFIGYSDSDYYYLYPETTFKEIIKFYQSQGQNFPVSKNTLSKHMESEKLIECKISADGKTNYTPLKKVSGKPIRFWWVNRNIFEAG